MFVVLNFHDMKLAGVLILLFVALSARSQNLPSIHYTASNICYLERPDTVKNWQKCKIAFQLDWKGDQLSKVINSFQTQN